MREAELRLGEEGEENVWLSLRVGELGERARGADLAARAWMEDLTRAEACLREAWTRPTLTLIAPGGRRCAGWRSRRTTLRVCG